MKKFKTLLFIPMAILCLLAYAGCILLGTVEINQWSFKPQQASGTEVIFGSTMEFDFTIENYGDDRALSAGTFKIAYVQNGNEYNAEAVYLDNLMQTSVNFHHNESRNVKIYVITSNSFSNSEKIVIKYDGQTIIEYLIKQ